MRKSVEEYGQTMVMVTHDARAAAIADRVLFLADGLIVKDMPRSSQGDILAAMTELTPRPRRMTRFALKGLLGRKLRTTLTAIAIVLGVAMVSGTYVLTDSIDQAFDSIFTDVREGSTVVITGKSAFDLSEGSGASATAFDESLLGRVRQVDGVAQAEGGVDSESTHADRPRQQGDRLRRGAEPRLLDREGDSPFNPLALVSGEWPGPNEVVIDEGTADKKDFEIGDTIGVQAEGPVERLRISGIVRFAPTSRSAVPRSPASTSRRPSACSRRRASSTRSRSRPSPVSTPTS